MADARQLYRQIYDGLRKLYPSGDQGNFARNLNTLASFICGIILSGEVKLADVAAEIPNSGKEESLIMRLRRWLKNEKTGADIFFTPLMKSFLAGLGQSTLTLVIDGTATGGGCVALMVSVLYKGRTLPLLWVVRKGKKGHFPESMHIELIKAVKEMIPEGCNVVCLGDGEFDGTGWLETLAGFEWKYVCRTAKNSVFYKKNGEKFVIEDICPDKGGCIGILEAGFTTECYGPVTAVAWWEIKYKNPVYLVTNFDNTEEACRWYKKRFRIETMFSDLKSRGFNLHKSCLKDPDRISNMLIAAALAYVWVVLLGRYAYHNGWNIILHRTERCDLSMFSLGKRLLKRFLKEQIRLPPFNFNILFNFEFA